MEVTEAEKTEEARKLKVERERLDAQDAAKKKRERNAKVIDGVKKTSMGVSAAGILWDVAEFLV